MKKCPSCGKEFEDHIKYCTKCGTSVIELSYTNNKTVEDKAQTKNNKKTINANKKPKGKMGFILMICVLVVFGIIAVPMSQYTKPKTERVNNEDGTYYLDEYDNKGLHIKRTEYNPDNVLEAMIEYVYDADKKMIRETCYDATGAVKYHSNFEHNVDGIEFREIRNYTSGVVKISSYDVEGGYLHEEIYNTDGTKEVIKADLDGTLTGRVSYDETGTVTYTDERDIEGRITKACWYENGILTDYSTFEYLDGKEVRRNYKADGTLVSVK